MKRKRLRKGTFRTFELLLIIYILIAVLAYLTNPFTKYSQVTDHFQTRVAQSGELELIGEKDLRVRTNRVYRSMIWLKSGQHLVSNIFSGGKKSGSKTLETIIQDIHTVRFNPSKQYLISGDHFSTLYPRSLGIFYHSLLDSRTALDQDDWLNRQRIYLKTTAYALDAFRNPATSKLSTTIVPLGGHSVSLINFYSPPSDTLYSLLYALDTLQSNQTLEKIYPAPPAPTFTLMTAPAAKILLEKHQTALRKHLEHYLSTVQDPQTGLIKTNILLSGAKDSTKRQSAFYDNVILWKTLQLSQKLGLIEVNTQSLETLKAKILSTLWMEKEGCFLEDLSPESIQNRYYSSDWLVVLMTGFLDPQNPAEQPYFSRCVAYIQAENLDKPFGLKYQQDPRKQRQHFMVRALLPSYGATTIWSNWGMEYVKVLVILYHQTGKPEYLEVANQQLSAYTNNILKYGCYPEVYDLEGNMLKSPFYKSVCQTGWVVSYEQAKKMVESVSATPLKEPLAN